MKQLLTFFGLACFISWIIWLPLYGHILGLTNLPTLPFQHAIGGLGPLIAFFLTTYIFLKKDGVKKLLAKCFQIKPLLYLAIALLSPFILAFLATLISCFIKFGRYFTGRYYRPPDVIPECSYNQSPGISDRHSIKNITKTTVRNLECFEKNTPNKNEI